MPRRLPVRPAKILGNFFVLFILTVIFFIYYSFVFVVWGPRANEDHRVIALLIFYNILFAMLLWCFFQTMTTDPGQVPVFWGFHLGDNENKRRRYCLMCNVFKPERCHHCSACNRCVLNMDHHCPWINNCVGFWNRKQFLLLLMYALICVYVTFIFMAYDFYKVIVWGFEHKFVAQNNKQLQDNIIIILSFIMDTMICFLITAFLRFHIKLARENKTTIENLDKKGQPFKSIYDLGPTHNWKQIFGNNPWLYPFPIFCGSGKPVGDGITWDTIQSQQEKKQREQKQIEMNNLRSNAQMQQQQQLIGGPQNNLMMNPNNVQSRGNLNDYNQNSHQELGQRIFNNIQNNQGRAQQLQNQIQGQRKFQVNQQFTNNFGGPSQGFGGGQPAMGQIGQKNKRF